MKIKNVDINMKTILKVIAVGVGIILISEGAKLFNNNTKNYTEIKEVKDAAKVIHEDGTVTFMSYDPTFTLVGNKMVKITRVEEPEKIR